MKPKQGYSELRKHRSSVINKTYHLTFSTKSRIKYFNDFNLARKLIKILKQDEERGQSTTLAFVIMPDHVHWLMNLTSGNLALTVKRIKRLLSKEMNMPLWNEGYYDHNVRDNDDLVNIARYIVANPLRAGLVRSVKEYPHWDAVWL